jgi:hypothetical protein
MNHTKRIKEFLEINGYSRLEGEGCLYVKDISPVAIDIDETETVFIDETGDIFSVSHTSNSLYIIIGFMVIYRLLPYNFEYRR